MMNPRYQIFVSSTFRDLRKERQAALDAILELGHFPAGMEVFPAADSTPWELIETIITESDYYILIIGGVYGSTDENGISYTEREYDYAISRGIPILAFLHGNPAEIPSGMVEMESNAQKKLNTFRRKVEIHHCKYWTSEPELKAHVLVGLVHSIRVNPRVGWIRGDTGDSPKTLQKLSAALEENKKLISELKSFREEVAVKNIIDGNISSGSDMFTIKIKNNKTKENYNCELSWDEIFIIIGPVMLSDTDERSIYYHLQSKLVEIKFDKKEKGMVLDYGDFTKIIYQFLALEHIEPTTLVVQEEQFKKPITRHIRGFRLTKKGAVDLGRINAIKNDG